MDAAEEAADKLFQSTRLYKPRLIYKDYKQGVNDFNPRGYISLDSSKHMDTVAFTNFNPRGYISLDDG